MSRMTCQNCGAEVQDRYWEEEGLYICAKCNTVIGYDCKGCGKFFSVNHLMLHQELYLCKICGRPHWGYTDWKRKQKPE